MSELIYEAANIIPENHKQHHVPRPNNLHNTASLKHLVQWVNADRNCVVCSTPKSRKRTNFVCSTCDVYLHPKNCFEKFHNK